MLFDREMELEIPYTIFHTFSVEAFSQRNWVLAIMPNILEISVGS